MEYSGENLSGLKRYITEFHTTLNYMENTDRPLKVSIMDAITLFPVILQQVAYSLTALLQTQTSVERFFSTPYLLRSEKFDEKKFIGGFIILEYIKFLKFHCA